MVARNPAEKFQPGEVISSVSDYLNFIENHCTDYPGVLFRGHRLEDKDLLPKIARIPLRDERPIPELERAMLSEFKRRGIPYLDFQPRTDWDWLALAQHNGMPTRLLDWTANPLVALWFVVERSAQPNSKGTVWIFFPSAEDYVSNPDNQSPFEIDRTMVFRPNHLSQRIVAQDGWFTVHKYRKNEARFIAFQNNSTYKKRLSRIAIPHHAFASLRFELNRCGLNAASIYPDLQNLSRHIEWMFSSLDDEREE